MNYKLLALFILPVLPLLSIAHTLDETNAVVRHMLDCAMNAPEMTCFDEENTNVVVVAFPTFDSLFSVHFPSNNIGFNWTRQEKREAFDYFWTRIVNDAPSTFSREELPYAYAALIFALNHGYTNCLDAAKVLIGSTDKRLSSWGRTAFADCAIASNETSVFVEELLTNMIVEATIERNNMYAVYGGKLIDAYNAGSTCVATNGALMLYRNFSGGAGGKALDMTLLTMFPTYEASSNRLEVANQSLGWQFASPSIVQYFTTVTNQLHQAAQPLPVVPELSPTP